MNIALDFDDTYTKDPFLWNGFISNCLDRGHDIRIVTFRKSNMRDEMLDQLELIIPVIYTEYLQKKHVTDQMNWPVDIWIDDSPHYIISEHYLP